MARKNPPPRQIQNPAGYPAGTIKEEFWDGTVIITNPDGTKETISKDGKVISGIIIKDEQIELWKKMPKEEALKEALKMLNEPNIDVPEGRLKLEILKFIAEVQNAIQPAPHQGAQIVAIRINVQGAPEKVKDIEAKVISNG